MTGFVAIITGASSGIGAATALRLARDFDAIVLAARDGDRLANVGTSTEAEGATTLTLEIDLTAAQAAETVVGITLERFGRIDALINIAGAVPGIDLFEMTDEQWARGMELKFHAAPADDKGLGCAEGGEGCRRLHVRHGGRYAEAGRRCRRRAQCGDRGARQGLGGARHCRRNSGQLRLTRAIMTGRRTAMLETMAAGKHIGLDEAKRQFLRQAAIARFGEAEEIAEAMAFVVSPAARRMTGTVLRIDGGEVKSV